MKLLNLIESLAPSSILETSDEILRRVYLSGDKLDITRLSGERLEMENCYINLGRIKMTTRQIDSARPSALEPLQQSLLTRLRLEEAEETDHLELSTLFDEKEPGNDEAHIKRILIRGQAGIGKSTLCKKIVHEFYTNKMWRTKFDRILWIPLRHIRRLSETNRNLENLLAQELITYENTKLVAKMHEELELDKFDKTLFLLDGLDEVHSSLSDDDDGYRTLLDSLIDKPNVIVTSRPHFRVVQRRLPFDMEAQVLGLTPEQVDHYIASSSYGSSEDIREFLQKNDLIQSLVRIPIQLDALCYTWIGESRSPWNFKDPPRTMTELYQAMELMFRRKDVVRRGILPKSKMEEKSDDEIRDCTAKDTELMEFLAFSGLCLREVNFDSDFRDHTLHYFNKKDLVSNKKESITSILHDLSFLRSSDPVRQTQNGMGTYHFLHLTFQEFFAARYFARKWANRQPLICLSLNHEKQVEKREISAKKFLHENKYFPSFVVFWRFASGLLKPTPADQDDFFETLDTLYEDLLGPTHQRLVMHCLMEARQDMPLRPPLESRISKWLRFELREFGSGAALAAAAECPDSSVLDILKDTSPTNHSALLKVLEDRLSLSTAILEAVYDLARHPCDDRNIREVAGYILKKNPLPTNIKESILQLVDTPDDETRMVEMAILASHHCLSLVSKTVGRYINHNDPKVRRQMVKILLDSRNDSETASNELEALRKGNNQEARSDIFHFLDERPNNGDKLTDSILAPLPDDSLRVQSAMVPLLEQQKVLTPYVLQAVFQYLHADERQFIPSTSYSKSLKHDTRQTRFETDKRLQTQINSARARLLRTHQAEFGYGIGLLLEPGKPNFEMFLRDLTHLDHLPDDIISLLTNLLEDEDTQIRLRGFWILASQSHLSDERLDNIITILQSSRMNWDGDIDFLYDSKLSSQFLQELDSLLVDGNNSIRQFVRRVFSTQRWLSTRDLDTIKTVFQNPHNVNHHHIHLCQRLEELPEQVEKGLATVLGQSNPELRLMASSILQSNRPLRDSTLKFIFRYLEEDQSPELNLAAIEALHGSEKLPDEIWSHFAKLLDAHAYARLPIINAMKNARSLPSVILEALIRLFEDENGKVQTEVHHFLMHSYKGNIPKSAIEYFMSRFEANSKNKTVQAALAEALGAPIFDSPMASTFVDRLAGNDEDVQLAFMNSFSVYRPVLTADIDFILPLFEVSTDATREAVIESMYHNPGWPVTDKMAEAIAPLLRSCYGGMRVQTGYILARHHSGDYFTEIAKALRHSDCREMASNVLRKMTKLPPSVIHVLTDLLQDETVETDAKEEALAILDTEKYDRTTNSSKRLLATILPLLENDDLCEDALNVLWRYDDLSGQSLGKTMLGVKDLGDRNEALMVFLSHCDETDISSLINDSTAVIPFWKLALECSWHEAVSFSFISEDVIRLNMATVSRTITLRDSAKFRKQIQLAREEMCERLKVESLWGPLFG